MGVRASAVTGDDLLSSIEAAVRDRRRFTMMSQNLHSVYTFHHDAEFARAQDLATAIRIDGTPIVWFGRLLGLPFGYEHRAGWMDWLDPFMRSAVDRRWRIYYLGSKPGVVERGAAVLRERYPGLAIEVHHGYFELRPGADEFEAMVERINRAAPDVVIVGMGMPRQERFILHAHGRLLSPVLLTAGACMDYVAGELSVPPRWLGMVGLEWAYRLVAEPRRLWRRYLVEPWFCLGLFAREYWGAVGRGRRRSSRRTRWRR